MATTVDQHWIATQPPNQAALSRRQLLSIIGDEIRVAVWVTMRQANELGGQVRKGEHSQIVVFWKVDRIANSIESEPDEKELNTEDKGRQGFVLKVYRLFNVEQCELPQAVHEKLPKVETYQHDLIEAAERIMARMPNAPEIEYARSKAFYSSMTDRITLPCRELFSSAAELYATAFHVIGTVALDWSSQAA